MVLTDDLAQVVAYGAAEVLVRLQDFPVRRKFDDGLRFIHCRENGIAVAGKNRKRHDGLAS